MHYIIIELDFEEIPTIHIVETFKNKIKAEKYFANLRKELEEEFSPSKYYLIETSSTSSEIIDFVSPDPYDTG